MCADSHPAPGGGGAGCYCLLDICLFSKCRELALCQAPGTQRQTGRLPALTEDGRLQTHGLGTHSECMAGERRGARLGVDRCPLWQHLPRGRRQPESRGCRSPFPGLRDPYISHLTSFGQPLSITYIYVHSPDHLHLRIPCMAEM